LVSAGREAYATVGRVQVRQLLLLVVGLDEVLQDIELDFH